MRMTFLLGVFLSSSFIVLAQVDDRDEQARIVKAAIGGIAAKPKAKVEIVTRELRRIEGRIEGVYPDYFVILPKGQKKPLITIGAPYRPKRYNIAYRDVLQFEAKALAISFVPNPNRKPFASWDEVSSLGVGVPLQIDLSDGKRAYGALLIGKENSLTLMRGNRQIEISRDRVTRIYRITADNSTIMAKILAGAQTGADITDDILPISDASARANPLAMGIGAAIGALIYILPKGTKRVLVFAR